MKKYEANPRLWIDGKAEAVKKRQKNGWRCRVSGAAEGILKFLDRLEPRRRSAVFYVWLKLMALAEGGIEKACLIFAVLQGLLAMGIQDGHMNGQARPGAYAMELQAWDFAAKHGRRWIRSGARQI